jgi:hypothetical protein
METKSIILVLVGVVKEPIEKLNQLFGVLLRRSLESLFVPQTFESCHDNNKPLLHVPNNPVKNISVILVLVAVVRKPIEWLHNLFASC